MHNILDVFQFWPVVSCPLASRLIMGKIVFPLFLIVYLLENYSKYFGDYTCWVSGKQSFPFGLLVSLLLTAIIH